MKCGFIGLGNMAAAIIRGMLAHGMEIGSIFGFDKDAARARQIAAECGVNVTETVGETVNRADVLVLAVKPQVLPDVLPQVAPLVGRKLVVSIAAGRELAFFEGYLPEAPLVRVMPNINAVIGSATSAICANRLASAEHVAVVRAMFETVGTVSNIPEQQFAVFSAIAGASPAFTYMYIDALARAAVKQGMPRAVAQHAAASAVLGSARMVMQRQEHPMELVDMVCSPGGTTIEGVWALRENGFEAAVNAAVAATVANDKKLASQ